MKYQNELPKTCDSCGGPLSLAFVDGRTTQGSWAKMCLDCFSLFGVGLGTGKGQKYDAKTGVKLEG